jgi:hypothetical protein
MKFKFDQNLPYLGYRRIGPESVVCSGMVAVVMRTPDKVSEQQSTDLDTELHSLSCSRLRKPTA